MQSDEHLAHRARKIVVHGEILALPIDRRPKPLHLLLNRAAVMLLPLPHALDEFLAPKFATLLAFTGQLALDHHLRRDASMVRSRQPQSREPAHAVPAKN